MCSGTAQNVSAGFLGENMCAGLAHVNCLLAKLHPVLQQLAARATEIFSSTVTLVSIALVHMLHPAEHIHIPSRGLTKPAHITVVDGFSVAPGPSSVLGHLMMYQPDVTSALDSSGASPGTTLTAHSGKSSGGLR